MIDVSLFATVVDWKALWETALASLVAGVGVTLAASVAIYGFATFAEARRDERGGAAILAAVVAAIASLAFMAAIGAGLVVMIGG